MKVLITGASKGIGREMVKLFASDVTTEVHALSSNTNLLSSLHKECLNSNGNKIYTYTVNLLADDLDECLDKLFDQKHPFDIVINNAGLLVNECFDKTKLIDAKQIFQVNFFAPALLLQKLVAFNPARHLLHVVNVGSMGGYQGSVKFPGLSFYSSSKAALANLTESLAEEYKDTSIKFNCLALGSVNTEMLKSAFPNFEAAIEPKQMAEYIVEFSKNGYRYFNGKVLPVALTTP